MFEGTPLFVQVHEVVSLCHRKTSSRHYEKYALKKNTFIPATCVLGNISGLKSQERSPSRRWEQMNVYIASMGGREGGIFGGGRGDGVLTDVIPNHHYFL